MRPRSKGHAGTLDSSKLPQNNINVRMRKRNAKNGRKKEKFKVLQKKQGTTSGQRQRGVFGEVCLQVLLLTIDRICRRLNSRGPGPFVRLPPSPRTPTRYEERQRGRPGRTAFPAPRPAHGHVEDVRRPHLRRSQHGLSWNWPRSGPGGRAIHLN